MSDYPTYHEALGRFLLVYRSMTTGMESSWRSIEQDPALMEAATVLHREYQHPTTKAGYRFMRLHFYRGEVSLEVLWQGESPPPGVLSSMAFERLRFMLPALGSSITVQAIHELTKATRVLLRCVEVEEFYASEGQVDEFMSSLLPSVRDPDQWWWIDFDNKPGRRMYVGKKRQNS